MLIGLNGFKGSGKDTVGAYLVENYGFTRLSFADKLKESAAALFGIKKEKWDEWKNFDSYTVEIKGPSFGSSRDIRTWSKLTAREFLQRYGTESHRDVFGYDFWVDALLTSFEPAKLNNGRFVITDARFDNELVAIRSKPYAFTWQIVRAGYSGEDHPSEIEPEPALISHRIFNSGTLEELYAEVDLACKKYAIVKPSSIFSPSWVKSS